MSIFKSTGPEKPFGVLSFFISSEVAKSTVSKFRIFLYLGKLSSWSPLIKTASNPESVERIMVFTTFFSSVFKKSATSVTETIAGVSTIVKSKRSSFFDILDDLMEADSTLAAKSQSLHDRIKSSPVSARTINSWEELPPIIPESAWTALKVKPHLSNILLYASNICEYDFSEDFSSTSKLYASFITNSLALITPNLGLISSRNLGCIW